MPIFTLASHADMGNIDLIRNHAMVHGSVHFIPSTPPHHCDEISSETIALVVYNTGFKVIVQDIVRELYTQYGAVYYGLSPDTSEPEFIQLKMGSCICGFTTF